MICVSAAAAININAVVDGQFNQVAGSQRSRDSMCAGYERKERYFIKGLLASVGRVTGPAGPTGGSKALRLGMLPTLVNRLEAIAVGIENVRDTVARISITGVPQVCRYQPHQPPSLQRRTHSPVHP